MPNFGWRSFFDELDLILALPRYDLCDLFIVAFIAGLICYRLALLSHRVPTVIIYRKVMIPMAESRPETDWDVEAVAYGLWDKAPDGSQ